jgi:hypothetical protein
VSDTAQPLLQALLRGPLTEEELAAALGRTIAGVRKSLAALDDRWGFTRPAAIRRVGDWVEITAAGRERALGYQPILQALAEGPLTQGEVACILRRETQAVAACLGQLARNARGRDALVVGERVARGVTRYSLTAAGRAEVAR